MKELPVVGGGGGRGGAVGGRQTGKGRDHSPGIRGQESVDRRVHHLGSRPGMCFLLSGELRVVRRWGTRESMCWLLSVDYLFVVAGAAG